MPTETLKRLILPPGCMYLLGFAGLLLVRRRPRLGRGVLLAALVLLWALSTPLVSATLLRSLQDSPPLDPGDVGQAGAIVVLGGDLHAHAPEYDGTSVAFLSLERLRYGARLHRETDLPLMVTGGVLIQGSPPVGELMAETLRTDFDVQVRWVDTIARNTRKNALRAARLLEPEGIDTVVLVTHAWHMPRAKAAFEAEGLAVLPAPTMFASLPRTNLSAVLPAARPMRESAWAIHEWLGRLWYALTD